jgi:hypothetical protein
VSLFTIFPHQPEKRFRVLFTQLCKYFFPLESHPLVLFLNIFLFFLLRKKCEPISWRHLSCHAVLFAVKVTLRICEPRFNVASPWVSILCAPNYSAVNKLLNLVPQFLIINQSSLTFFLFFPSLSAVFCNFYFWDWSYKFAPVVSAFKAISVSNSIWNQKIKIFLPWKICWRIFQFFFARASWGDYFLMNIIQKKMPRKLRVTSD